MHLRIVTINDVYLLDNLPRLRSLVKHHATHDPADVFLVTLAGDFVAPSILSSLDAGRGMVDCLNRIPITHVIVGNHEDDIDTEELHARLCELRGTVLLTNVHGFADELPRSQVMTIRDEAGGAIKLGLLGVVDGDPTLYRRPPFGGARIEPANDAAMRAARELRAQGCDCVIAFTHQPMHNDRALAEAQRDPPFPVIIGGHEHLAVIEKVRDTTIVKGTADATQVVVLDLRWSAGSGQPSVETRLEETSGYPEDRALRARVDKHLRRVRELENATLVVLAPDEALSSIGTRSRQTTMGTLIASRVRDSLGAEACLFNGGGIRGSRDYRGRLTYGDVKTEVPFDNEVVLVNMPGRYIREAVASSRRHAPAESGGFLQVDDATVVDDQHRVISIDGAPLDDARDYRVALVRNLLEGMDKVEPLVRFAKEMPDRVPPPTSGRDVKVLLVSAFSARLWEQLGGFDAIDTDHDGVVTADELLHAIARVTAEAPSKVAAGVVLHAFDTDHDQRISRAEVEATMPKKSKKT